MAENRSSGPQIGQIVIYTQTASVFYPALIVSVSASTGTVRLDTFAPGAAMADQQNVSYDGTGTVSGTWRYPDGVAGL